MNILLTNKIPVKQFYTEVENTHMEGTVSQISYLGLGLILFEKTRNFL